MKVLTIHTNIVKENSDGKREGETLVIVQLNSGDYFELSFGIFESLKELQMVGKIEKSKDGITISEVLYTNRDSMISLKIRFTYFVPEGNKKDPEEKHLKRLEDVVRYLAIDPILKFFEGYETSRNH